MDRSLTVEDILGGGVDLVKPGLGLIQQIIVADADEYIGMSVVALYYSTLSCSYAVLT